MFQQAVPSALNTLTVDNRYHINLHNVLGHGHYGKVCYGVDAANQQELAVKIEDKTVPPERSALTKEIYIYNLLQKGPRPGIPTPIFQGETNFHRYLGMPKYGDNLDQIRQKQGTQKFTLKTVLLIGDQMLNALQFLHGCNVIHRDIKPDNIVTGPGNSNTLYLIDYGLSKCIFLNGRHIKDELIGKQVGTVRFSGLNAHLERQLSRRDDLQALAFTLIFLLNGSLPWQTMEDSNAVMKEKKKMETDGVLGEFLRYSRNIGFEAQPLYQHFTTEFKTVVGQDTQMDWNAPLEATYYTYPVASQTTTSGY